MRAPAAGCLRVTRRESQVLGWIAAGKSDWAIGRILNISGKTVNFHVENAKRKFGVGTRVQAVVAAMREGVISQ
jgi:DNA-binding CsgD family transcriptional regulator